MRNGLPLPFIIFFVNALSRINQLLDSLQYAALTSTVQRNHLCFEKYLVVFCWHKKLSCYNLNLMLAQLIFVLFTIVLNFHGKISFGQVLIQKSGVFDDLCAAFTLDRPEQSIMNTILNQTGFNYSRIHFISAATKDIYSYAVYALAINFVYISSNNFNLTLHGSRKDELNSSTSLLVLDSDARWNKVQYFIHALSAKDTNVEWFVWLDADLVIVDFSFDFDAFINTTLSKHPNRDIHIIMSKDKDSAQFVANTGCMIVRNSLWSLRFFELWWNTYDRSGCCDQNALTWLYHRTLPSDIQEKMLFVPADAINTRFPSFLHHHPNNSFLHLAGFSSLYRIQIFRLGVNDLCASIQSQDQKNEDLTNKNLSMTSSHYHRPVSPQLTLTLTTLQSELMKMNQVRKLALEKLMHTIQQSTMLPNSVGNSAESWLSHKKTLLSYHRQLEDIMKYEDDERMFVYHQQKKETDETQLQELLYQLRKVLYLQTSLVVTHSLPLDRCHLSNTTTSLVFTNMDDAKERKGVQRVSVLCKEQVEAYKDMISLGIESVITGFARISSFSHSSHNPTHFFIPSLETLDHIFDILLQLNTSIDQVLQAFHGVRVIQEKFTYYQFKHHQFMAQWCSVFHHLLRDFPVDNLIITESEALSMMDDLIKRIRSLSTDPNGTNNIIVDASATILLPHSSHLKVLRKYLATYHIYWLQQAKIRWEFMVHEYQYYGTNYVLADPEKEYIFLLFELGIAFCEHQDHHQGVDILFLAIERQQKMIRGYQALQITTDDIIRHGIVVLGELYFNTGFCLFQGTGKTRDSVSLLGQENKNISLSLSLLMESVELIESVQAQQETRAYPLALQYMQEVRKHLVPVRPSSEPLLQDAAAGTASSRASSPRKFKKRKKLQ